MIYFISYCQFYIPTLLNNATCAGNGAMFGIEERSVFKRKCVNSQVLRVDAMLIVLEVLQFSRSHAPRVFV